LYFFRDGGTWITATSYLLSDIVQHSSASYICVTPHTSGTFATDVAAGKWVLLGTSDATIVSIGALTGSADKSIYFTGADVAALYDLTAAGRALLDDASASAQRTTLGLAIGTDVAAMTGANSATECIVISASDETTGLTTGTGKVSFRMPYAFTLSEVRASLKTAQVGGNIFTVDVNEAGASVISTKLTIDNGEKTSTTAATPPSISDAALANDAEITVDIDQIGDGTATGLKVYLIGKKA
jgi:hypothetical protein